MPPSQSEAPITEASAKANRRIFIRRSYGIWIVIPTIQVCTIHPFFGGEVELRWLLWGIVIEIKKATP